MKILLILNDPPYGTERSYNGLRLAKTLGSRGAEITVFLLADAVVCAKAGQKVLQGYYNLELMVKSIARQGDVLLCGTCMDARGLADKELVEGAQRSARAQPERVGALATREKDGGRTIAHLAGVPRGHGAPRRKDRSELREALEARVGARALVDRELDRLGGDTTLAVGPAVLDRHRHDLILETPLPDRREHGVESDGADESCDDEITGLGRDAVEPGIAGHDLGDVRPARSERGTNDRNVRRVRDRDDARSVALRLLDQSFDAVAGGDRDDVEARRVLLDDVEGLLADAARAAEDREPLATHGRPWPSRTCAPVMPKRRSRAW